MRVGIDLDNCVFPFVEAFQAACGYAPRPATRWHFYEELGMSDAQFLERYERAVDERHLFLSREPFPDAVKAINAIYDAGHSVHIVTDRFVGEHAQIDTVAWLDDWEIPRDSLTFAKDKTIVRCDTFVDDRVENVDALRAVGCAAWLLDRGREEQQGHRWLIKGWEEFLAWVGVA